ncbi:MAG: fimbrillin family protein [Bacteroides sp.]|nr:fimbrillin family protein [Bacteroides sp.]
MKQFHLYTISVALLLLSACSNDTGDTLPMPLHIEVSASDFTDAGDANTRATDSGNTTTFENGDRIGITVLGANNQILADNIPYRYNGSTWNFDSSNDEQKTAIYYDNKISVCLAYFPYSKDADNISGKDALKEKFKPQPNQRSKDTYRASDLLMWSETYDATTTPSKNLKIAFSHAYSSLLLLPSIKYNIDESTEITYTPSSDKEVSFTVDIESLFPYPAADGSYRIIVAPQTTDARWFYGYGGKTYGGTTSNATLTANTRYTLTPTIDIGEYGLGEVQMGDFYCMDGASNKGYLIPGDTVALPAGTNRLGVVLKVGRETGDWKDDCQYKLKDTDTDMNTVNGYVLALYDANGGNYCQWCSYGVQVEHSDMNREKNTGFYGYKNTHAVISFAESKGWTLNAFPAVYCATDAYELLHPAPASTSGWFFAFCRSVPILAEQRRCAFSQCKESYRE